MRNLQIFLFLAIFTTQFSTLIAQDRNTLVSRNFSETVFVTADSKDQDINKLLGQGVRAFIINERNPIGELNRCFPLISKYLTEHSNEILSVIITGNTNASELQKTLEKYQLERFLSSKSNKDKWAEIPEMIKRDNRLVIFAKVPCKNTYPLKNTVLFADFGQVENPTCCLSNSSDNKLICYNPLPLNQQLAKNDTLLLYRSFYIWDNKGQIPTFLISPPANLSVSVLVADSLNSTPFYKGIITCNNQTLNNIHRMMHKEVIYSGSFSIPYTSPYGDFFTPWKEGYRFYPEIVNFDNHHILQQITAIKLRLEEDLLYFFSFEKGARNDLNPEGNEKPSLKLSYKTDKIHGRVAVFNTAGAAIQCEKNTNFRTQLPFTISIWVKPYKVNGSYAILSKGQIFSLKILDKRLSFTRTGFAPKVSNSCVIIPNVWQHLTWVYVPNYHIQFFVNGKLVDEQKIGNILENDYSVTIGNNFSNDGFRGEMDELKIWNRALSCEEIHEVYIQKPASSASLAIYLIIAFCLITASILLFQRRKTKKKAVLTSSSILISQSGDIIPSAPIFKQGIFLFGPLLLINEAGDNLVTQLTPKMKQLFLLLILNSKGVSINHINEVLWPCMDEDKAKQNRNYTIQQLKKVIAKMDGVELNYHSKNWILQMDEEVYIDWFDHDNLLQQINDENINALVNKYIAIIEKGKFIQEFDHEIFDPIKARVSDNITDSLLLFSKKADCKLRLSLGNALLLHDSLNEDGLRLSLKSLSELGRNGEALIIYNSFCKRYKNTYNEDFSEPFSAFC